LCDAGGGSEISVGLLIARCGRIRRDFAIGIGKNGIWRGLHAMDDGGETGTLFGGRILITICAALNCSWFG
jgi:hypothetical protein